MLPSAGSAKLRPTDLHRKAQQKPNGDFGRIKHANTHKEQEQTGRNVQRKLVCTAKRASGGGTVHRVYQKTGGRICGEWGVEGVMIQGPYLHNDLNISSKSLSRCESTSRPVASLANNRVFHHVNINNSTQRLPFLHHQRELIR